ncbi:Y-family DNA polymerase [Shewanella sp. 4t3-1-2LB]|uniref:Y-family DNA polymerase n=1 Tax=Shewanella sp. 4t3-1-2LB TaxID=2817682 RepID=UPI001A98F7C5|nr:Y-family DNA polymerase [Shewanella sp. 4t3-1-2LB]MBO1272906.1 Y-family DNA polymerase [Shewanella sp. 4t3-1-2LB]
MFALVDANSFYASAEVVFRPDWRGRAVIVLSNNDGCIVAANREAKAAGIAKFKPFFEVREQCQANGVIACSSNYELYGDLSARMMQIIGRFAPEQHIYSIDECFLNFQRIFPAITDLRQHGQLIRRTVWKEAKLPVCVGMAPTLTLAKAANHAAKQLPDYHGVCVLDDQMAIHAVLQQMDVADVWGIGRQISKKLQLMDIHTAAQLAAMPPKLARKQLSIEIERTVLELNGIPCKNWDQARADKQQIYSTRSVGERITSLPLLQQALAKHIAIAAAKLRKQGSLAGVLFVFAHNSPFDDHPAGFRQTITFPVPTADSCVMAAAVSRIVPQLFKTGVRYYKIGVGLLDLTPAANRQLDLFDASIDNNKLMQTMDTINCQYGTDTIFIAAQGITPRWAMRRKLLTPQYTTRWQDIPKIRC